MYIPLKSNCQTNFESASTLQQCNISLDKISSLFSKQKILMNKRNKHIRISFLPISDLLCCNWREINCMAYSKVFSIWCVWSNGHTLAHAPLVSCVWKIARATSLYDTYCLGHRNEGNERKIRNIKLNSIIFLQSLLTFC